MKNFALTCLILLYFPEKGLSTPQQEQAVLHPGQRWLDTDGNHINAHGGGVIFHEGTYYWYGEHKLPGKSEDQSAGGGVHCYSSGNLASWHDEGLVLTVNYDDLEADLAYGCILERPKVLFNEQSRNFVMYFKYYPRGTGYDTGYVGVATAKSPTGPFRFQHKFLGAGSPKGSGDFAMYRDRDGVVYHVTVRKPDKALCIGRMREDYLFPADGYQVIPGVPAHTEAPAIMHRDGKYFLLGSGSSSWKPNAARALVSDAITGPYKSLENPAKGMNPHNGSGAETTFGGQISFVIPVVGKPENFIAMLDVWKPEKAIEGLYIWLPIEMQDGKPIIRWRDQWTLQPASNGVIDSKCGMYK